MIDTPILKVKDHPNLYRDPNTKAIMVVDQTARQNYLNQRAVAARALGETEKLSNEITNLKSEITDIKALLSQISSKLDSL